MDETMIESRVLEDVTETLEDANAILAERTAQYGDPGEMLTAIGKVWGVMLGSEEPIEARRVALMLAGMKLVRETAGVEAKRDNRIDAICYLGISDAVA